MPVLSEIGRWYKAARDAALSRWRPTPVFEWRIKFPESGLISSAAVTQVDERLYLLDNWPLLAEEAIVGDVIEANRIDKETLEFVQVVKPGNWKVYDYMIHGS